jgi:Tfp pilus assembly protein PilN
VKPIHLNLASRPYEDKRLFITTVVAVSIVVAALLFSNIDTYLRYRVQTHTTRTKIADLDAQTEQEHRRAEVVKQQLSRIDVEDLSKQTAFINDQLAQRAFSWSELLDKLEGVLADDVRLTSIAPSFRPGGSVFLSLTLEAKSADGLVNMLKRFNKDPQFANAFPTNESAMPGGGYRITLSVEFKPQTVKTTAVKR